MSEDNVRFNEFRPAFPVGLLTTVFMLPHYAELGEFSIYCFTYVKLTLSTDETRLMCIAWKKD